MRENWTYRYGIAAILLALSGSVVAAIVGSFAQPKSGFLPVCIGKDALGDGFGFIDIFWTCPEPLRFCLMLSLAGLSILAITWVGFALFKRQVQQNSRKMDFLRFGLAGLTVGIISLVGIYVSEFSGGQGKLNRVFLLATPLIVSLMHFPSKWGIALAVPLFVAGFISLVLIAGLTGIPLD